MYDLFKEKDKKKNQIFPFSNQTKKKTPSFLTNITAVISLSVEIPD